LAEQQSSSCLGNTSFLRDYRKDDQQIQIDLAEFLQTHSVYDHYA
jgi:hypothetical protein